MLNYLVYLLTFVIGSIAGLVYSYKLHGEPYVADDKLNILYCIISIAGWVLAFISNNMIIGGVGFILAGFVMGARPGYGRKETAIGLFVAVCVKGLLYFVM